MWCVSLTHHSCDGKCLVAQTAGACAFDVWALLVDLCVHDVELDREDRPNTAGCVSAATGDWASGRVDVPSSVPLAEPYEMQQRPAASSAATESSNAQFSF